MRRFGALAAPALLLAAAAAQEPEPDAGLVALRQACLDAANDGVVLNVAAHPDDESSRTNTMLRRKYGLRVITVYSTYGDGGQNAIGKEIGPELAWLRVRETLRAAAMMDVEVRWLGMTDFGFSKTLEETLAVWDRERLRDAMRKVVDEIEPDLVFTNHTLGQGHGHHRASFWAISEVLAERARSGRPAPRLYSRSRMEDAQLTLDPSELEPGRGETYARLAHRAWTQHVTQGPWGPHNPLQVAKDHWRLVFPEGVEAGAAGDLGRWLRTPAPGTPLWPERPAVELAQQALALLREQQGTAATPAAARRLAALQRIVLAHAGVRVETWLQRDEVPRGGSGLVNVVVHGAGHVQDLQVSCRGVPAEKVRARIRPTPFDGQTPQPTGADGAAPGNGGGAGVEPAAAPRPEGADVPGRYAATFKHEGAAANGPEPAWIAVDIAFAIDGMPMKLRRELSYTAVDPVELQWDREAVIVPRGQTVERILSASVTSYQQAPLEEAVRLMMGPGIRAEAIPGRINLSAEHPDARLLVRATFASDELGAQPSLRIGVAGERATLRLCPVEVFVPPGLQVGLVRGPDDTIERALADLGVAYVALDRDSLATTRLEQFTSLLLDMRAYHHRPELAESRDRLLQYCRAGGRIVAMYHKPNEWNERTGQPLLAPFPLTIGNDRITEESSPVKMLQPEHRLWHHPHAIVPADFDGWVQERGLNFPSKWDPAWTPLLELQDSGDEKPHQGALLYTQYGRGDFVYCSLVLYRQLRIGHAGAARMLVNLLAR